MKNETGIVFDQVVGAVIKYYREKKGLNQYKAAEQTGISVSSLSRLEKGDYSLSMEQLMDLSKCYDTPMSEIAGTIEQTQENAQKEGFIVAKEKKSKTALYLLGAAAIAALVLAN